MLRQVLTILIYCLLQAKCEISPEYEKYMKDYSAIKTKIFEGYDTDLIPKPDLNTSLDVSFNIVVSEFVDLSMGSEKLESICWTKYRFRDFRLKWNPGNYSNIKSIVTDVENLWKPDVRLLNSAGALNDEVEFDTKAEVRYTGYVKFGQPRLYTSTCKTNAYIFPFDVQTCNLSFSPWRYSTKDMHLYIGKLSESEKSYFFNAGGWILERFKTYRRHRHASDVPILQWSISLKRLFTPYLLNILVPTILIASLSSLIFFIPAGSSDKIDFGITMFLTLCVNALVLSEAVPASSSVTPLITKVNCAVTSMIAASLLFAILSNRFIQSAKDYFLPYWFHLFLYYFGLIFFIKFDISKNTKMNTSVACQLNDISTTVETDPLENILQELKLLNATLTKDSEVDETIQSLEWLKISTLVDRICALIYILMCTFVAYTFINTVLESPFF